MRAAEVVAAARRADSRIRPLVVETPVVRSEWWSGTGLEVWCKLENRQVTGSFKVRGAVNRMLQTPEGAAVIAASTGNHGAAVAYGASRLGRSATVVVPSTADQAKVERISGWGAEVVVHGHDPLEAEVHARGRAAEVGAVYVSPYNDPAVVAGQGTLGIELTRQLPEPPPDAVYVAVGGGGLAGGMAAVLAAAWPETMVVGCSPANSPAMVRSIEAGRIVQVPTLPTLSDGTAGGLEPDSITFPLCEETVARWVTVTEDQIGAALRDHLGHHDEMIEGAAAVALAGLRTTAEELAGGRVVVVLCGGNIATETLSRIGAGNHPGTTVSRS